MSIKVHRHPKHAGAVVEVRMRDDSWHGHYVFSTVGLSDAEIAARHAEIVAHHRAKSERHEGFNALDRAVLVNGVRFHIHGLALVEQGTDVRLILRVTAPGGHVLKLDRVVSDVSKVPTDAEILDLVRVAAASWLAREREASDHVTGVRKILGLQ
jgi:hypothetical protein